MPTLRKALAVAALSLVLTGCNDDTSSEDGEGDEAAADVEPPAEVDPAGADAAEEVVRSFYEDFGAQDFDAACARWTEEYAARSVEDWNEDDFGKKVRTCPELLAAIVEVFELVGEAPELLEATETTGELVDDDTARVEVVLASSGGETETYVLTLTDTGWLISGDVPTRTATDEASPTP